MTLERRSFRKSGVSGFSRSLGCATLAAALGLCVNGAAAQSSAPPTAAHKSPARPAAGPQVGQQTFASAAEAGEALAAALKSDDQPALLKLLGPTGKDIVASGDETADKNEREQMAEKYQEMHRLRTEPDGTTTLYIGAENWPAPIPLMHKGPVWYFDTAAGKQEILYRRIGRNELAVIQVCSELVDAQKEYYGQPHDSESANRYAEKFFSDPDKHNGLYWKAASGEPESPIGPLVATATAEGYTQAAGQAPEPFDGYYFRMLKAQGRHATSHAQSFAAGGETEGGFAFVAYPAKYRASGVMTFVVNQDGVVYEKDLGPRTEEIAKAMTSYHREASWRTAD
jgi:Protein of unknown function (DUF2950)